MYLVKLAVFIAWLFFLKLHFNWCKIESISDDMSVLLRLSSMQLIYIDKIWSMLVYLIENIMLTREWIDNTKREVFMKLWNMFKSKGALRCDMFEKKLGMNIKIITQLNWVPLMIKNLLHNNIIC